MRQVGLWAVQIRAAEGVGGRDQPSACGRTGEAGAPRLRAPSGCGDWDSLGDSLCSLLVAHSSVCSLSQIR